MYTSRPSFTAVRRLGMTLTLVSMLAIIRPAKAAEITITITGTLEGGGDGFPIFDAGKTLDGKPFTLVYTFDDTKGAQTPLAGCKGTATGTEGYGPNSPATAILTVGTKSYTFGLQKNAHAAIWREISSACSDSQIDIEINEGKDPEVSGVSVRLRPPQGKLSFKKPSLTQNPDWRAPFSTQDLDPNTLGSGFAITRIGDINHLTKAGFNIMSLTVSGPKQTFFKGTR